MTRRFILLAIVLVVILSLIAGVWIARVTRLAEAWRFYVEGWPPGVEWDGGDYASTVLSTR